MVTYIILALVALVVVLGIIVAIQPSDFRVARTMKIAAPASAIFPHINDLHRWEPWSPWEKLDPALTRTYSGAEQGIGASYAWSGNNKVGEGRMTIVDSRPHEHIRMQLEFVRPFKATNMVEFVFRPADDGQAAVTWNMTGNNNFMGKAFSLVMNMDKMIGRDFEKGLAQLKAVVEGEVAKQTRSEAATKTSPA